MSILGPDPGTPCRLCKRLYSPPPAGPPPYRRTQSGLLVQDAPPDTRTWTSWDPTCKHEHFFTCPDCESKRFTLPEVQCSVCGCNCFYC